MRSKTKVRVAVVAAAAAVASAGTAAALAATTGGHAPAAAASQKPGSSKAGSSKAAAERQGHDAISAAVAAQLHLSTAQVSAALQPLFAAGEADPSSPVLAAAARSLGVSAQQLYNALVQGKESLAGAARTQAGQTSTKSPGNAAAQAQQGHDAMTAAVAAQLHLSTAQVSAALQPLFAAGGADTSSAAFAAAARSLGVSTQQLAAALGSAKQSLAQGA